MAASLSTVFDSTVYLSDEWLVLYFSLQTVSIELVNGEYRAQNLEIVKHFRVIVHDSDGEVVE
jgi:hypothetical protein